MALLVTACSTPKPVLYPNDHLHTVGKTMADQDIADCRAIAEQYGATAKPGKAAKTARDTTVGAGTGAATGAVGGVIAGAAGRGAAIGAAMGATLGLLGGVFKPSKPGQAHVQFVNRCLTERGYEVIGWD